MKLTTLAFMTVLTLTNVAHAQFTASYPTISYKVVSLDNIPLKNVSVAYLIRAEKLDTCGKGPGHSQWFSVPCYRSYIVERRNVVTNEKGEATLPAFTVNNSEMTSKNPSISIVAEGYTTQIKTLSGKKLNCITNLPGASIAAINLNDQENNSAVNLDEVKAQKYAGKTITLRAEFDKAMMDQYYVEYATNQMQVEYDSMVNTDYYPSFLENNKCK